MGGAGGRDQTGVGAGGTVGAGARIGGARADEAARSTRLVTARRVGGAGGRDQTGVGAGVTGGAGARSGSSLAGEAGRSILLVAARRMRKAVAVVGLRVVPCRALAQAALCAVAKSGCGARTLAVCGVCARHIRNIVDSERDGLLGFISSSVDGDHREGVRRLGFEIRT